MRSEARITAAPPHAVSGTLDDACIQAIAQGDKDALRALYEQTKGAVYGFALSIVKHPQDAEDILQDTFIQVYSAAHMYRPMGKPMAWILTIARNLARMRLREQSRRAAVAWEDCELFFSETSSVTTEDVLILRAGLSALRDEEFQIITLHAVIGWKHREIAQFLNMPLSTVLSKYNRAIQKLRAQLGQEVSI